MLNAMHHLHIVIVLLLSLYIHESSATTDTISAGQALDIHHKLISKNGRYALGFFKAESSQNTDDWYLGIWFNSVPKFTQAWVANRDDPIKNSTSLVLKISHDGNLVILNQSTNYAFWSTQANKTGNNTIAMLLNSGNFILKSISNSSNILWQSFDHPTDTFLPEAKIGWDRVTGLNRRFISRKNSISPGTGAYCWELDPNGVNQMVATPLNSFSPYWSSGKWNGQYFDSVPELSRSKAKMTFIDNAHEKYFTYAVSDETLVVYHHLAVSGQILTFIWDEGIQDWLHVYTQPKTQCDVFAVCGPFTTCNDEELAHCTCMKGFSIRNTSDWDLDDQTGGCMRNTPLDCIKNGSTTISTDKFYSMPCVSLSQSARKIEVGKSIGECSQVCLNNCSCTAYSISDGRCSIWHDEVLSIRQLQCGGSTTSNGETLYLRLASKDVQNTEKKPKGFVVGLATGTSIVSVGLIAFVVQIVIRRNKRKRSGIIMMNSAQGFNGIIAFRYIVLKRATRNFSEKLGEGGFGSVFKGFLEDSTTIAVKSLDYAYKGEKQFRAEVSSIGVIQHINLVKLIGFCCEGSRRLLVYEHMPNGSLDIHLFQSHAAVLQWVTRYQIALGVARGLAYLHENCRDCIIHCDIKPENILLSDSFVPKIADFGMAKLLGRDFSRVLTTISGTIGYLAPEWISGVAITPKVDVYAYGMVLLEIVCGRRNTYVSSCSYGRNDDVYYPIVVAQTILDGDVSSLLDHRLCGDVNLKEAEIVCKLACWCIQDCESDRPTMAEVVQILEGVREISIPPIPRLLHAISGSSHSTCS